MFKMFGMENFQQNQGEENKENRQETNPEKITSAFEEMNSIINRFKDKI